MVFFLFILLLDGLKLYRDVQSSLRSLRSSFWPFLAAIHPQLQAESGVGSPLARGHGSNAQRPSVRPNHRSKSKGNRHRLGPWPSNRRGRSRAVLHAVRWLRWPQAAKKARVGEFELGRSGRAGQISSVIRH